MKRFFTLVAGIIMVATLTSSLQADKVITNEDGMTVVNTTTLGSDVIGYVDTTPLKIYIKKNKVVKVEALKNQETPKYMAMVKRQLLSAWNDKKVSEAATMKVDAVTGATFTSEAVIKNVQRGLEYYQKKK